jgi:hypothetical protein
MKIANGIWSILGILAFFSIEKIFPDEQESSETTVALKSNKKHSKSRTTHKTSKTSLKINSKRFMFFHSFKVCLFILLGKLRKVLIGRGFNEKLYPKYQ